MKWVRSSYRLARSIRPIRPMSVPNRPRFAFLMAS
jgi:hypothetical protein